jgi:hypothetical protein
MPPLSRPHRRLTRRGSQRRLARLACKRRTTFSRRRSTGYGEYAEYSPESESRLETGARCGGPDGIAACRSMRPGHRRERASRVWLRAGTSMRQLQGCYTKTRS